MSAQIMPINGHEEAVDKEFLMAMAKIAHEILRAYHVAIGEPPFITPAWDDLAASDQARAMAKAEARLASTLTVEQEHSVWLEQKRAQGWEYGPKFDEGARVDPLLVRFEALPEKVRVGKYLIDATVRVLAEP